MDTSSFSFFSLRERERERDNFLRGVGLHTRTYVRILLTYILKYGQEAREEEKFR